MAYVEPKAVVGLGVSGLRLSRCSVRDFAYLHLFIFYTTGMSQLKRLLSLRGDMRMI